MQLLGNVVDGCIDDEADKGQHEAEDNKGETQAREIRSKGQDEKHDGAGDVRGNGVQVGLDGGILESRDDLGQEERDRLDGHAEADFDEEEAICPGLGEDLDGVLEVEFLGNLGG